MIPGTVRTDPPKSCETVAFHPEAFIIPNVLWINSSVRFGGPSDFEVGLSKLRIVPVRQSHTGIPRCDLARIVILHHSIEKRQIGKTVDCHFHTVPFGIGVEIDPYDIALRRKCQRSGIEGVMFL